MKPDISEIMTNEELRKTVGLTIEDFDEELKILGNTAIKKLVLSAGVSKDKIVKEDSYIKQTIMAYIRGNFRYTDPNIAEENRSIFEENKNFMSLLNDYTSESEEEN